MFTKNRKSLVMRFGLTVGLVTGMLGLHTARFVEPAHADDSLSDVIFPTVTATSPEHGDVLSNGQASLSVQFSVDMLADGTSFAVNKSTNYLLVEDGVDGEFQTVSCAGKLGEDDSQIPVTAVTYNFSTFTTTLSINNGTSLGAGSYQLLVCGSTRINDLLGNKLNGGTDSVIRFQIVIIEYDGFAPYVTDYDDGIYGYGAEVGDLNSDGFNDVAMTTQSELAVYLQNNEGGLNAPVTYKTGLGSQAVAIGDLNNDGRDDVVTGDNYSKTVSVFLQQPDGTLADRVAYSTLEKPYAVALGDVNGDQLVDIVVVPSVGVFTQKADGGFNPIVNYPSPDAGWDDVAVGDVNNDGRNDVVKMNGQGINPDLSVYLQNPDGILSSEMSYWLDCSCIGHGVDIGDVTGDGLSDVVVSYGGNRPSSKVAVFAQREDSLLQPPISYDVHDIPSPIELADVNLDGNLDVLTLNASWFKLSVLLQESGILLPYVSYAVPTTSNPHPQAMATGDINGDGAIDVVIADYNSGLTLLYHNVLPMPQVVMGGNTFPLDGEELGMGISQVIVQFNRRMRADGEPAAVNSAFNYLLVEDGMDDIIQTSSCAIGVSGDDTVIGIDAIDYNASTQYATLFVNMGEPLGLGNYRLLVCNKIETWNPAGIKLNKGLSDTKIDFVVWPTRHTISGNAGLPGVTLNYIDGSSKTAIADGSGDYSFRVSENWSGIVTPTMAGYVFSPTTRDYTNITSDQIYEDYIAETATYTISGNVGLSDVSIKYSDFSGQTNFVLSDINGDYSITIPYGWSGRVTPLNKDFTFLPDRRNYSNVVNNIFNEDYIPVLNPYTISGNVGVEGVSMGYTLGSGSIGTAISDQNGNYFFTVWAGWSGTVKPSKDGYLFTPATRGFSNVQADRSNQDFIAQRVYVISGNAGIAETVLNYFDGIPKTAIADQFGNYSFLVPEYWSGTVSASKAGYIFSPLDRSYIDITMDQTNQDYTATPTEITFSISGNTGTGEVALYYLGGTKISDDNGNYSLTIPYGWSGTVMPSKLGYRFTPASRGYTNLQMDQTAQDFIGTKTFTISGNAGVAGAILRYTDGTLKTTIANSSGNYTIIVPVGWSGEVIPSKTNVSFSPSSKSYLDIQGNLTSQNYTATITIINNNNSGPGSLRQAIADAVSGATVHFAPALAGQSIILGSQLVISKNLNIDGSGLDPRISISGNRAVRIINIDRELSVTLQSLILRDGKTEGTNYTTYGGAIFVGSATILTINDLVFMENTAPTGGAMYVSGYAKVIISESEFLSNLSDLEGGAIYLQTPLNLTATRTKFVNNSASTGGVIYMNASGVGVFEENKFENNIATFSGGAIASNNSPGVGLYIRKNLFSGNSAGTDGGAISISRLSSTSVLLENNTFYGNQAETYGGGATSGTGMNLFNNTFSDNRAGSGGASLNLITTATANKLYNNILANSISGSECNTLSLSGSVTGGNNIVEDGSGPCGVIPGTIISDPILGSLSDNGGFTQTVALGAGSPAINAGDDADCAETDQRGVARPQGSQCDIGAYEYESASEAVELLVLSTASQDGWILESSETSNKGGKLNKTATTLRLGDDAANRQYRSILSFDTSTLPEGTQITSVTLKFKYAGKSGTDPFTKYSNLLVDICIGAFKGNSALQLGDFKPTPTCGKNQALIYTNTKVDNWYSQSLNPGDFDLINLDGVTQFRLRFSKDDNNDFGADFLKLYSGNAAEADRPQLIIEYSLP